MADRTVAVRLVANVAQYQAAMGRAAVSTGALGKTTQAAGAGVTGLQGNMGKLTKGLIGAAGAKKAFDLTAGAAIAWESAFAGVKKTVEGTPQQLAAIGDGLRQMSKEIPTTSTDLAAIAESAGQLGIETPNVLGFTKVIADLGETTNLAGQEGATQLARLANITQMSQDDFDRLGSTVVQLGNNLATTEAEIVQMGLRLAGAGAQVGLTEAEILSLAGALSSVGVEAEAGGSAFSRVIVEVNKAVKSGSEELDTFARMAGMSAAEFQTAWGEDAAGTLATFIAGLGGVVAEGGNADAILEELGLDGIRVADSIKRAAGAGDLLTDALELGNEAWEENNALTKEAAQRYETTESKIQVAKNALSDLGTEIGEGVLPLLGELATGLTDVLGAETRLAGETLDLAAILRQGITASTGLGLASGEAADGLDEAAVAARDVQRAQMDAYVAWQEGRVASDQAADGVEGYGDAAAGAAEELEELTEAQKDLAGAVESFFDPLDTYTEMVREVAEATAEATSDSKDAWQDYAESADVSLDEFATALEEQIADLHAWEDNLVTIAARSNAGFAMELAKMGPGAAGLVRQLAGATDTELARVAANFAEHGRLTGDGYTVELEQRLGEAATIADMEAQLILDAIDISSEAHGIGMDVAQGFIDGLVDMYDRVTVASSEMGNRAARGLQTELIMESPSKVFEQFGIYSGEGYEIGLNKSMTHAFQTITPDIAPARATALAATGGGGASTPVDITLMMDGQRLWHSRGFIDGRNQWIATEGRLTGRPSGRV